MLYVAVGDGGKRDDIRRLAQNPFMLNGKVLRIDVNSRSEGLQYGIPEDNPFVGQEGVREEIWATGLRNPWGIDYDLKTGLFWLADVGQNAVEEVNLVEKGANYGWSFREGDKKFAGRTDPAPDSAKFTEPVAVYGRPDGTSITGGVVYYGSKFPDLKGQFLYGDWGTGHIWAVSYDQTKKKANGGKMIFRNNEKGNPKQFIFKPAAFTRDPDGEVLVLSWNGGIFEMTK
jgi:glucose/arabinose dehydrogenase